MHDDAGTPAKDTRTWAKAWAEAFPTAAAPDWWPLHMKFSTQFKNFHVGFTTPNVSSAAGIPHSDAEMAREQAGVPPAQPLHGHNSQSICMCNTLQCQPTHGHAAPLL